jgi:hypothetical protein
LPEQPRIEPHREEADLRAAYVEVPGIFDRRRAERAISLAGEVRTVPLRLPSSTWARSNIMA